MRGAGHDISRGIDGEMPTAVPLPYTLALGIRTSREARVGVEAT